MFRISHQILIEHYKHMHVTVWLTVLPSNFVSVSVHHAYLSICVSSWLCCVSTSPVGLFAIRWLSPAGGQAWKRSCRWGVVRWPSTPLWAKGFPCCLSEPMGKEGGEEGSEVDVYHAVLAPPLAAVPAVLGRLLPHRVSFILPWHVLWHVSRPNTKSTSLLTDC